MILWAGIAVWALTLTGVFGLLWRVCKVSERLRKDDPMQRQREAEGADRDVFEERAA